MCWCVCVCCECSSVICISSNVCVCVFVCLLVTNKRVLNVRMKGLSYIVATCGVKGKGWMRINDRGCGEMVIDIIVTFLIYFLRMECQ